MFSSNTQNEELGIIYDIGSASVAAAIVLYSPTDPPRVLYVSRQAVRASNQPQYDQLEESLRKAARVVTSNLTKEGIPRIAKQYDGETAINSVAAVFSAPWIASETKTITIENEEPVAVTERYMEDVLEKERAAFQKSLGDNEIITQENSVPAEQSIIQTRLNGYETQAPYGKRAHRIEASIYLGFVVKSITDKITDIASQEFNVDELTVYTYPLTAHTALTSLFEDITDSLLIDVSGEVTSISLIHHNALRETVTVPYGQHALLRAIGGAFDVELDIAASYLRMFVNKQAEKETTERLTGIVEDQKEAWRGHIEKTLAHFRELGIGVPVTTFLTCDQYARGTFHDALTRVQRNGQENTGSFKIISLDEEATAPAALFSQESRRDIFVALEAGFFNIVRDTD